MSELRDPLRRHELLHRHGIINPSELTPDDSVQDEFFDALVRINAGRERLAATGSSSEGLGDDEEELDLLKEWSEWELMHRDTKNGRT